MFQGEKAFICRDTVLRARLSDLIWETPEVPARNDGRNRIRSLCAAFHPYVERARSSLQERISWNRTAFVPRYHLPDVRIFTKAHAGAGLAAREISLAVFKTSRQPGPKWNAAICSAAMCSGYPLFARAPLLGSDLPDFRRQPPGDIVAVLHAYYAHSLVL